MERGRRALLALAGLALLPPLAVGAGVPARYIAGEHYRVLDAPVASAAEDGQIRVIEFFLYSCPHCYAFEPKLEAWLQDKPGNVVFRRVPVMFGPGPIYARVFYTAKALGVLEKLHEDIFNTIHKRHKPLREPQAIRAYFVAHGVDGKAFDQAFHSAAVDKAVAHARQLTKTYGVLGVPSMGVAGKYWTGPRMAGGFEPMLDVVNFLLERERG